MNTNGCPECDHIIPGENGKLGGSAGSAIEQKDLVDATSVQTLEIERLKTGGPWDEVWGGGFAPGTCTLLGGPPGIGKTTLLLQLSILLALVTKKPSFFISAEQHKGAIKTIIDRVGLELKPNQLFLLDTQGQGGLIDEGLLRENPPGVIVFDSIPALCGNDKRMQMALAKQWIKYAQTYKCISFLVTHMTKTQDYTGSIALQDAVDVLITITVPEDRKVSGILKKRFGKKYVEGVTGVENENPEMEMFVNNLRALTPWKNRYGATGQDHFILMTSKGFIELTDVKKKEKGKRK